MVSSVSTLCLFGAILLFSSIASAQCPSRCQSGYFRAVRDCEEYPGCVIERCNFGFDEYSCTESSDTSSTVITCPNECTRRSVASRDCRRSTGCELRRCSSEFDGYECASIDTSPPGPSVDPVVSPTPGATVVAPTVSPVSVPPSAAPSAAPSSTPTTCTPPTCDFWSKSNPDDPCAPCISRIQCDGKQRVRREYRDFTAAQREAFVRAVTQLNANGVWGQVATTHDNDFGSIHGGGNFFPWHAGLLFFIESWMMDLEPDLPGMPYFAWGAEENIRASTMWDAQYLGGSSPALGSIPNGPFQGFSVGGEPVTRHFSARNVETATELTIAAVIANEQDLPFWRPAAEEAETLSAELELLHDVFHLVMSGTMASGLSPRDPAFYLHHAYVDKWWSQDWPSARGFNAEDQPTQMLGSLPLDRSYPNLGGMSNRDSIEFQRCVEYQDRGFVPQRPAVPVPPASDSDLTALAAIGGNSVADVEETGARIVEAVLAAINTNVIPQINQTVIEALNDIANQFNTPVPGNLGLLRRTIAW